MIQKSLEVILIIGSLIWFAFIASNVNPALGQLYIGMGGISLFMYIFDDKKSLPLESRTDNRLSALLVAIATWGIFIVATSFAASWLEKIDIGGLIRLIGASTPALAQSKILNFLTFAFPLAFIETNFWARMYDFFANRVKISPSELTNFVALAFILSFAFVFMMFHVTAKGMINNVALLTVFLMMVTSYVLMFIYKEQKQAILFHMTANSVAAWFIFFG